MSKRKTGEKLTEKQQAFCREYLVDHNGAAAAKRAGYSERTARVSAQDNLAHPACVEFLQQLLDEQATRTQVTADRVILELGRLAFSDIRKLFDKDGALLPVQEWSDEAAAAVASVEVDELFEGFGENRTKIGHTRKVKLWDKVKANDMLGKHLRLWVERLEHTGPNGGPIQTRDDGMDLSKLTIEELEELERIREAAESRSAGR